MTEYIDVGDGILIDLETGEIVADEANPMIVGADPLFFAAQRLMEANDQVKAWERMAGAYKAVLLKRQQEKRAQYGDVVTSVRQNIRKVFDYQAAQEWLRGEESNGVDYLILATHATGFDFQADGFKDANAEELRKFIRETPTKAFIVAERVRKLAPGTGGER